MESYNDRMLREHGSAFIDKMREGDTSGSRNERRLQKKTLERENKRLRQQLKHAARYAESLRKERDHYQKALENECGADFMGEPVIEAPK